MATDAQLALSTRVVYAGHIQASRMLDLSRFTAFDWDAGNDVKNWSKHRVSRAECEDVFFHLPLLLQDDASHSTAEARYYVLGRTGASRKLFLVFTPRGDRIRVISARDMTKAERRRYLHEEEG